MRQRRHDVFVIMAKLLKNFHYFTTYATYYCYKGEDFLVSKWPRRPS